MISISKTIFPEILSSPICVIRSNIAFIFSFWCTRKINSHNHICSSRFIWHIPWPDPCVTPLHLFFSFRKDRIYPILSVVVFSHVVWYGAIYSFSHLRSLKITADKYKMVRYIGVKVGDHIEETQTIQSSHRLHNLH